jgi:Plasmid encoded RepA protein
MPAGRMAGANVSKDLVVGSSSTLEEQAVVLAETGGGDPQFLHAVLCQLGLPRNPTPSRTFERTSGRASLSLQAGRTFDGKKWNDQPLPSGTRPRLVLINLCSESVRTKSPDVDIGGSVREFLRRLSIDAGGRACGIFASRCWRSAPAT